jgi:hypothetical protein
MANGAQQKQTPNPCGHIRSITNTERERLAAACKCGLVLARGRRSINRAGAAFIAMHQCYPVLPRTLRKLEAELRWMMPR